MMILVMVVLDIVGAMLGEPAEEEEEVPCEGDDCPEPCEGDDCPEEAEGAEGAEEGDERRLLSTISLENKSLNV